MDEKEIEIEIEAVSVREAIQIAAKRLKVPKKQLEIRVLSEGQAGLFGMDGAKPAKIKARIIK